MDSVQRSRTNKGEWRRHGYIFPADDTVLAVTRRCATYGRQAIRRTGGIGPTVLLRRQRERLNACHRIEEYGVIARNARRDGDPRRTYRAVWISCRGSCDENQPDG
jgi:hypothetical protein